MSSDGSIEIVGVSKQYRIYTRPSDRLFQIFLGKRRTLYREFWALRDISFSVKPGSTVGIVGKNGSGKSTLLQLICGTLAPTQGSIQVNGRLAALLELGSGFNPEFTGKENVWLSASLLGLSSAEIAKRYDQIVEFADIGDCLHQPVKTYSSGMYVRLAFAVAINVDARILVVDEALSVGDVRFQAKCFRKFDELRQAGTTIILVSHSPEEIVRHCDVAVLLDRGNMVVHGDPRAVVNQYLDLVFGSPAPMRGATTTNADGSLSPIEGSKNLSPLNDPGSISVTDAPVDLCAERPGFNRSEYRWGNRNAEIVDYRIEVDGQEMGNRVPSTSSTSLFVKVRFHRDVRYPIYGVTVKTPDGVSVGGSNSRDVCGEDGALTTFAERFHPQRAGDTVWVRFDLTFALAAGSYLISVGVVEATSNFSVNAEVIPLDRRYDLIEIVVTNERKVVGLADLGVRFARVA